MLTQPQTMQEIEQSVLELLKDGSMTQADLCDHFRNYWIAGDAIRNLERKGAIVRSKHGRTNMIELK